MDYEIECYRIYVRYESDWDYKVIADVGTEEEAIKLYYVYTNKGIDCKVYKVERMVFPNG